MCIRGPSRHGGFSLIELIMFIVIVSASVTGVLVAIDRTARASVDPLIIKQALAIAEALLEEVELMPFTFCDPDDAQAATAQSATTPGATACAAVVEGVGPEAGETRYSASTPFDNVNDYHGYDSAADGGIKDITGMLIPDLAPYRATVAVAPGALGGIAVTDLDGQANVLLITVTVMGPANTTVVLNGYRAKYSPRI